MPEWPPDSVGAMVGAFREGELQGATAEREEGASEWAELPEELLLKVLEDGLQRSRRESAAVRLTCPRWKRILDGGCRTLQLHQSATDGAVVALCAQLPALTKVDLRWASSLTDDALRAVAALTALSQLKLTGCSELTDDGLWEIAGLTSLTHLDLTRCSLVTDNGARAVAALRSLTSLKLGRYRPTRRCGRHWAEASTHLPVEACG